MRHVWSSLLATEIDGAAAISNQKLVSSETIRVKLLPLKDYKADVPNSSNSIFTFFFWLSKPVWLIVT